MLGVAVLGVVVLGVVVLGVDLLEVVVLGVVVGVDGFLGVVSVVLGFGWGLLYGHIPSG